MNKEHRALRNGWHPKVGDAVEVVGVDRYYGVKKNKRLRIQQIYISYDDGMVYYGVSRCAVYLEYRNLIPARKQAPRRTR